MNQIFATKGNLLKSKKSLALAKMGYELMDKKRNILIREMMMLVDQVKEMRGDLSTVYKEAYFFLLQANISNGFILNTATQVSIEDSIKLTYRSVMGVEVPKVSYDHKNVEVKYALEYSDSRIDTAYIKFLEVKRLTFLLAQIDNALYRLASAIRKTQKRANALKNIVIPDLEGKIKFITDALEEKEREEFSRLKVIKATKAKA